MLILETLVNVPIPLSPLDELEVIASELDARIAAAVPSGFEVSARSTDSGVVMGIRHPDMPIEGVQFHPESILTLPGKDLLRNFLEME